MRGPTFVVAGAARCGTTAVTEALRKHPEVFITEPKEPHYLALGGHRPAFTGPGDDTINRGAVIHRDQYLSLYPQTHGFSALGEGSVSTLYYYQAAISEIMSLNARMRLVVLLRDPVERAYSSYQYLRTRGYEPLADFLAAVDEEPRRIKAGWHHLWHYTGMSMYSDSLGSFLATLGRERVGVWFYDDLVTKPDRTVAEICRFIGVDPARLPAAVVPQVNVSGVPRSHKLQSFIWWARSQESLRRSVRRVTPFLLRERVRRANLRTSSVPGEVRQRLGGTFQADLFYLARLLDRPLPGWGRV